MAASLYSSNGKYSIGYRKD